LRGYIDAYSHLIYLYRKLNNRDLIMRRECVHIFFVRKFLQV